MKKNTVKNWLVYLAFMIGCVVVEPAGATTISDLKQQQQQLQERQEQLRQQQEAERDRLEGTNQELTGLEGEADGLSEEMEEIDQNLVVLLASVDMIIQEITVKEENIRITNEQYEEAKAVEEAQNEAMKIRIKFMYEKGETSYLEIFLGSEDFSNILNRLEYTEQLYEYDRRMLEEYKAAKEATLALKERLEEERAELEAQQHELEEEQVEMERLMAEKQAQYDNYEVQIARVRQQAAIYQANIKKQGEQIRRLQQEQAAKAAEEVAAVKAAEEARRAAATANDSSSGGSSGGGSANNGSAGGGNYAPPSSFNGGTGQKIAGYACQFVGNPYVSGGTSLTEGADCSGFVWRVYKDFGYSVPRTSWSFREAGNGVSYGEAQPGDIICYAGHVGIYIGNGYIVHASTERTGIKITSATYKEILAVRRIV